MCLQNAGTLVIQNWSESHQLESPSLFQQRTTIHCVQVAGGHTESGITFARQSEFIGFPLELYVVISKEIGVTDSENEEVMKDEGGRWAKDRGFL